MHNITYMYMCIYIYIYIYTYIYIYIHKYASGLLQRGAPQAPGQDLRRRVHTYSVKHRLLKVMFILCKHKFKVHTNSSTR